jgi:hypothetical protein
MLIAKGSAARFELENGWAHASGTMLHDPSGSSWPSCSLLFASFKRGGREATKDERAAREYLGREYEIRVGTVTLPTRDLSAWTEIGPVSRIEYTRPGTKAPRRYFHNFGERRLAGLFRKGELPTLYRLGRVYRLELRKGCTVDDRGIVHP